MLYIICSLLLIGGVLGEIGQPNANANANTVVQQQVQLKGNTLGVGGPTPKTFTVETGASPGRLKQLNDVPPTAGVIIFLDGVLGCDGKIGFWQFWASGGGEVCFGIYNKKKTKSGDTLLESAGRNCLEVQTSAQGFMEVEIPPVQRLSVNPSSVVAVEYSSTQTPPGQRVISVESNKMPMSTPGVTLGRIMTIDEVDIRAGRFFKESPKYDTINGKETELRAFPSFKAIVVGMSNVLDLRNGDNSRSGVAMIYMNKVWGTMCDRWYHEKGWPYLFCAEKDFPDTDQIFYTDSPARFEVAENTPIHLKNPRCKFSQNVTMFSCATHDNVTCNHTNDLFIRCKSKVDIRKGPFNSEGICYVYESNYWGTVCDARGLELNKDHWAHVCCREKGFKKGAEKIDYAKNVIVSTSSSVALPEAVSMHSPECSGGHEGDDIKMCKDGPLEYRCTHDQDVYVYCQT